MADLTARFTRYPESLRHMLALGSCGRRHLTESAALGLACSQGDPDTAQACTQMLLSAWGESPISGDLAGVILNTPLAQNALAQNALNKDTRELLRQVHRFWRRPDNQEYYLRLASQRRFDKLARYLEDQVAKEPDNLYWYEQALILGLFEGDYQRSVELLDRCPLTTIAPCLSALRCQAALLSGDHRTALQLADTLGDSFGPGFAQSLRARALDLAGDTRAASAELARAVTLAPWRTSQALVLSERLLGPQAAALPGSVAILLYSWNKGNDLDAALQALLASDLDSPTGGSRIFVLDNGSTDHTASVLDAWQQRAGDRLERIDLPVNVGAPAARNWLMHLDEVRTHDFCLYLDDDALVPPDWLSRLGAAVARFPDAGVWGCRVTDARQPALIQSADYHLHPLGPEGGSNPNDPDPDAPHLDHIEPSPIRLSNLQVQTLDLGQFDYCRPCVTVTGCCHLFRTETLLGLGGFSLFLSPSQYDDMEHDLRLGAQGGYAAYQGLLNVAHRKRTGRASLTKADEEAAAAGNRYKLQVMHPRQEIEATKARDQERIMADLMERYRLLDQEPLD